VASFTPHIVDNLILMQDNACPHISRCVTNFLTETGITKMDWPAKSADMNTTSTTTTTTTTWAEGLRPEFLRPKPPKHCKPCNWKNGTHVIKIKCICHIQKNNKKGKKN
jgi:hypothetical protein